MGTHLFLFALFRSTIHFFSKMKSFPLTLSLIFILFGENVIGNKIEANQPNDGTMNYHNTNEIIRASSNISAHAEPCPDGWIASEGHCYYFNVDEAKTKMSWMKAQGECDMLGGYLAEPKTGTEQDFLRSEIQFFEMILGKMSWWIGLTDAGNENQWFWLHDKAPLSFSSWTSDSPNTESPNLDDCAVMDANDGAYNWKDTVCEDNEESEKISFICEKLAEGYSTTTSIPPTTDNGPTTTTNPLVTTTTGKDDPTGTTTTATTKSTASHIPGQCDESNGWMEFNTGCYKCFTEPQSQYKAEKDCEANAGFLTSVHSQEEQTFIESLCRDLDSTHDIWIGLYKELDVFKYTDGTEADYFNWGNGFPKFSQGWTLMANSESYKWQDQASQHVDGVYVCRQDL